MDGVIASLHICGWYMLFAIGYRGARLLIEGVR